MELVCIPLLSFVFTMSKKLFEQAGLTGLSLKNPYAVIVMALGILLIGLVSLSKLPVDILPGFKTPAVQILTFYPGMPTEIMEKDITNRLERWTSQANGIARQESKSMTGVSIVKDYFRDDIDPNTAMSQVSSLAISDMYYLPPGTIPPMVMPFDPTASIPLSLISVSSDTLTESELYDIAYFSIRNQLSGIKGVIAPAVYGGKIRRILVYLDPIKMIARNLSPMDVVEALKNFNVMIPAGSAKIGKFDYQINVNGMVPTVEEINDFPIKVGQSGAPILVRDIGHAEDSFAIQTNVVHINGKRQVYIPIYRQPGANTIQVVDGLKGKLKEIAVRIPKEAKLDLIMDQSHYVRSAIENLVHEGIFGAVLASIMILVFLGSFRSTLVIFLSIPLSILTAFIGLYLTGDTINTMTLGGLALAVGRLVDDSIVVLENIHRHIHLGKSPKTAAIEGTQEVAMPVLVATISTVVVFLPVVFLFGMGKYLFTPLALTVTFSMLASYVVSMTVVPVYCAHFFKPYQQELKVEQKRTTFFLWFDRQFEHLGQTYERILTQSLKTKKLVLGVVALVFISALVLGSQLGSELFPLSDAGQFTIRFRLPSGTRIEETEGVMSRLEKYLENKVPATERQMMVGNAGVLFDWPAAYTPNSGPQDAFIQVQLSPHHNKSSQDYVKTLREDLKHHFPSVQFDFDTGGLLTAALNFGLPSPINIQVEGKDLETSYGIAEKIRTRIQTIRGATDVRIQQKLDYPQIDVEIDRIKAAQLGLSVDNIVKNVVSAINSSVSFNPAFWIDNQSGNHYFLGVQYPEASIDSIQALENIPINSSLQKQPILLKDIVSFKHSSAPAEVNHLNITRVVDLYANVAGRDVGSVSADIQRIIDQIDVPEGYKINMRGEVYSMKESFSSLGFGLLMAMALVYLVMVAQFKSFLDPLIIMISVPLGFIGVIWMLFLTGTTLNIQSFMGTIFMVGIAVSNGVLLVDFANRLREDDMGLIDAVIQSGKIRLRPILMTSLAAILGLLPMAIGFGHGSEANIPLARAVIGGLSVSTFLTLIVIPILYVALNQRRQRPWNAGRNDLP